MNPVVIVSMGQDGVSMGCVVGILGIEKIVSGWTRWGFGFRRQLTIIKIDEPFSNCISGSVWCINVFCSKYILNIGQLI